MKEEYKKIFSDKIFLAVLCLKIIAGCLFASRYLTDSFVPFIKYFVSSGFQNPWNHFLSVGILKVFPYPPGMLLVFSIPYCLIYPFSLINMESIGFSDLFLMRIPILVADISIYVLLAQWFKGSLKKVLWLYWCSPVIFYINYYHGQLDAVPTALFLFSIQFLFLKRYFPSSILFAAALLTKGHLFIALPFYLIYCRKQGLPVRRVIALSALIFGIYLTVVSPVLFSEGYKYLVIKASEQGNIFILRFPFDLDRINLNLLLVPAALFILFMRYCSYEKINREMMILYFAMVFVGLVVLVPPMPGWYYWSYPFLVYFFIRNKEVSTFPLVVFSILYLFYFLTYEKSDVFEAWGLINSSIASLPSPVELFKNINMGKRVVSDLFFTLLQSSVLVIGYWIFKEGILSNEIYKPKSKPIMIGIGGDSGAGKDTTVNCFRSLLGEDNCIVLSGDDYHKWPRGHQEWKVYTHLNAYGNKLHDQLKDAIALKDGKSVEKVTYDHNSGQFTSPEKVDPNKIVFFVGLHPFYIEQMRNLYDMKIYISPDEDLRKYWKIRRDMKERGYTAVKVIEQMEKREDDSSKFIQPQKQFADIIIQFSAINPIDFEHIEPENEIDLKLKLSISNSIFLEDMIQEFSRIPGIEVKFWHEDDLKYQSVEMKGTISAKEIISIANKIIPNLYELTPVTPLWNDNYLGILQLVFLLYMSEVSKYKNG